MAGFMNKFLEYIGIEENDMEDEYYAEEGYEESPPRGKRCSYGQQGPQGARPERQCGEPPVCGSAQDDRLPSHQL